MTNRIHPDNTIEYTKFNQTARVKVARTQNVGHDGIYDEVLWAERPEDHYALSSPSMKGKRIVVIRRVDWLVALGLTPDL